jgi:hypothetical protein
LVDQLDLIALEIRDDDERNVIAGNLPVRDRLIARHSRGPVPVSLGAFGLEVEGRLSCLTAAAWHLRHPLAIDTGRKNNASNDASTKAAAKTIILNLHQSSPLFEFLFFFKETRFELIQTLSRASAGGVLFDENCVFRKKPSPSRLHPFKIATPADEMTRTNRIGCYLSRHFHIVENPGGLPSSQ